MKNLFLALFLICFVGRLFSQPFFVSDSSVSIVTYSYGDNGVYRNSATHFYVKNIGKSGDINVTVSSGSYIENKKFTVQENTKYEFISVFTTTSVINPTNGNISVLFKDSSGLKLTYIQNRVLSGPTSSRLVFRSGVENDWTSINNFAQTPITGIAVSGTNIFTGTAGDGVFLSTNGGVSWSAVNNGIWSRNISCITVSGTNLFAGANGNVTLSTNNGTNWISSMPANSGLTSSDVVLSLAILGTNLFAGTHNNGIFLSTNSGTSWTAVNSGLPNTSYIAIEALAVSGTNLFAGTVASGIFLSTNNGTSWTAVNTGLTGSSTYVYALAVSGTNLFAGTDGGVFLSTNNGTSWSAVNNGLTYTSITSGTKPYRIRALTVSGTNIFSGTYDGGIFLSTNNGTSWSDMSSGLYNKDISSIALSGTNLLIGTYSGDVFRRPLSDMITGVEQNQTQILTHSTLNQNYPNPFNPSTTISFSVSSKSFVSLKVFNILGREVATIVSREMLAGNYSLQWNAANMASGIYLYYLKAGSFTETKKLILLK